MVTVLLSVVLSGLGCASSSSDTSYYDPNDTFEGYELTPVDESAFLIEFRESGELLYSSDYIGTDESSDGPGIEAALEGATEYFRGRFTLDPNSTSFTVGGLDYDAYVDGDAVTFEMIFALVPSSSSDGDMYSADGEGAWVPLVTDGVILGSGYTAEDFVDYIDEEETLEMWAVYEFDW